jgi:NhaP-type Na+/H+ or K+/H+ antiporter
MELFVQFDRGEPLMSSILTDHLPTWWAAIMAVLAMWLARPIVVWMGKSPPSIAWSRTLRIEVRVTMRARRRG